MVNRLQNYQIGLCISVFRFRNSPSPRLNGSPFLRFNPFKILLFLATVPFPTLSPSHLPTLYPLAFSK